MTFYYTLKWLLTYKQSQKPLVCVKWHHKNMPLATYPNKISLKKKSEKVVDWLRVHLIIYLFYTKFSVIFLMISKIVISIYRKIIFWF